MKRNTEKILNKQKNRDFSRRILLTIVGIFGILLIASIVFVAYLYFKNYPKGEKVVYIKAGNIWVSNQNGNNPFNLTNRSFEKLQNATRTLTLWCAEGYPRDCSKVKSYPVDRSDDYNNNFFEKISLSPDGEHLVAFGYNDSVKRAIEANTKELNTKYLTGEYWYPQHAALYIFNLKNKTAQVFDLENKFPSGWSLFTNVQIEKTIWSPNNIFLNFITQDGRLYRFDITTGSLDYVPHSRNLDDGIEWPAYENIVFTLQGREMHYVDLYGLSAKNDTIIRKYSTYNSPLYLLTELTVTNERYFIGPYSGNQDNYYFVTSKDQSFKVYEYQTRKNELLLIKEFLRSDFIDESSYYANIKAVSPNGRHIILRKKDDSWVLYRLEDMKDLVSTESNKDFTPYYLKWSLDGKKFASCSKNLVIFNVESGTSNTINTDHCSDSDSKPAFDWNYLD